MLVVRSTRSVIPLITWNPRNCIVTKKMILSFFSLELTIQKKEKKVNNMIG